MSDTRTGVLFVCLGNICRSPIAEAVFQHMVKQRGCLEQWRVDSAAIGAWHIGKRPDHRATQTLKTNDVPYNGRARQIQAEDFDAFDYIFGMDQENMSDLERNKNQAGGGKAKLLLLGSFDPQGETIIRDPYYDSGAEGFKRCFEQCQRSCEGFLNSIAAKD